MAFADGPAGRAPAAEPVPGGPRPWSPAATIATALVALTAVAAIYGFNVRPMLLARHAVAGSNAWLAERNLTSSLSSFERAFAYRGLRSQEAIEMMAGHVPQVVATRAGTQPREVRAFVDRAIRELVALTSSPAVEVRYLRLLGTTAGSASVFEPSYRALAVASFNRALELSPGNENTYVALSQFYAADGDLATGMALLRKAMALAPDADGLRMNFVRLALRAGVAAEDDLAFAGRYVSSQRDLVEPAVQYLRDGDWTLALMVLDEMVRRDPDNAELREQRDSVARRQQTPAQPSATGR